MEETRLAEIMALDALRGDRSRVVLSNATPADVQNLKVILALADAAPELVTSLREERRKLESLQAELAEARREIERRKLASNIFEDREQSAAKVAHRLARDLEAFERETFCTCAEKPWDAAVHRRGCPWTNPRLKSLHEAARAEESGPRLVFIVPRADGRCTDCELEGASCSKHEKLSDDE